MTTTQEGKLFIEQAPNSLTLRHTTSESGWASCFAQSITVLMMLPFLAFIGFFVIVPLSFGTLFEGLVPVMALLFGLPSAVVLWYLLGQALNQRVVSLKAGSLRRYQRPLPVFNAPPRRVPLSQVEGVQRKDYTYSLLDAFLLGEMHLANDVVICVEAELVGGKSLRLLEYLSEAEAEVAVARMNAFLGYEGPEQF